MRQGQLERAFGGPEAGPSVPRRAYPVVVGGGELEGAQGVMARLNEVHPFRVAAVDLGASFYHTFSRLILHAGVIKRIVVVKDFRAKLWFALSRVSTHGRRTSKLATRKWRVTGAINIYMCIHIYVYIYLYLFIYIYIYVCICNMMCLIRRDFGRSRLSFESRPCVLGCFHY